MDGGESNVLKQALLSGEDVTAKYKDKKTFLTEFVNNLIDRLKGINVKYLLLSTVLLLIILLFNFMIHHLHKTKLEFLKASESSSARNLKSNTFRFSLFEQIQYPIVYNNAPPKKLPDELKSYDYSSTTVVSVYIELNKSKHSVENYDEWLRNLANSIQSPLAIVVNRNAYEKIRRLMENVTVVKFYVVEDIWAVLTQAEFERNMTYVSNYLLRQHDMDGEKSIHNPNLYAVWNMKCFIVYKIAQENPFGSSFFLYTDAGAFRERPQPYWPDVKFISDVLKPRLQDRPLYGQIAKMDSFNEYNDVIEGTFFGGSAKALKTLYDDYFEVHDTKILRGEFIGKEQNLMNIVAFKHHPQNIVRLRAWHLNCTNGYNNWFYYQRYFSVNSSYYCTQHRERLLLNAGEMDVVEKI